MSYHPDRFDIAVDAIVARDPRYAPAAYHFLKDALNFTVAQLKEKEGLARHVDGKELLLGFRDLALEEFGPMASTLLSEWGVTRCSDLGEMVFNLIDEQIFGRQENDSKEDFSELFSFHESFVEPFLPKGTPS